RHGIVFHHLYAITNAPLGRFRLALESAGRYDSYLSLLASTFNPAAAQSIMCRSMVSVGWDGTLYNCDFNQALGLPLTRPGSDEALTVDDLQDVRGGHHIAVSDHCYCCTAGAGSSCTGSLAA
ncbi:MAG TPA: DUF3641 domain-containing protein, partial [Verrucomicrobiae bacterium]|nr:DUF3641 domain-containing protein [Verrucomicrobiae bacterium]